MSRALIQRREKEDQKGLKCKFALAIIPLLLSIQMGCAKSHKKEVRRSPSIERRESKSGIAMEVKRLEQKEYASIQSPQRTASLKLVAEGKTYMRKNNLDKALNFFQQAIIVDSTNGIAYYYLALVQYKLKRYDQALSVIEKAESLLSGSREWQEMAAELKSTIREEVENQRRAYPSGFIRGISDTCVGSAGFFQKRGKNLGVTLL